MEEDEYAYFSGIGVAVFFADVPFAVRGSRERGSWKQSSSKNRGPAGGCGSWCAGGAAARRRWRAGFRADEFGEWNSGVSHARQREIRSQGFGSGIRCAGRKGGSPEGGNTRRASGTGIAGGNRRRNGGGRSGARGRFGCAGLGAGCEPA